MSSEDSATQFIHADGGKGAGPSGPALVVVEGPGRGTRFPLSGAADWTIGRLAGSAICLESKSVSKEHARISCSEGRCWITDLRSTNGLHVNGVRIEPGSRRALCHGDTIAAGECLLFFHAGGEFVDHRTGITKIQFDAALAKREADDLFARFPDLGPSRRGR